MEQKSETDRSNECDVRSWTGEMETSFKLCWLCPGPVPPTRPPRFPQPTLIWAERELDLQGRLVPPLCSQTSARRRYGDRAEQWSCRPVALFTEDVREGGKDGESFIMLNEMYE